MQTNYKKGRSFEYRVKKILEKQGFYVIRSAGSQGAFDLIAIKRNILYLYQLKKNKYFKIKEVSIKQYYKLKEEKKLETNCVYKIKDILFQQFVVYSDNRKIIFKKI